MISILFAFVTSASAQGLSCVSGFIPPELVVIDPVTKSMNIRQNVFLLYEPEGCEAVMPLLIRVDNRLPGTCVVPHWSGAGDTTRVVSDVEGHLVPTIVRDQAGQEQSCIPYGVPAWTFAPSRTARISADVYAYLRPSTAPGLHDRLDNGYPALNVGMSVALPNGGQASFPSPLVQTCPSALTIMAQGSTQTRDSIWFDGAWCNPI